MKIIIGLGNPGKKYENTRHNLGFLAIEQLRKKYEGSDWEDAPKFNSVKSEGNRHCKDGKDESILFIKPLTFMNLSGDAVGGIVNYYKLDPDNDILVLSDDLDMEFGKVRYREEGSHGGQNGLKDIITKLGTNTFARIKIGIGRDERFDVSDWVLSKLKKEELLTLEEVVFPKVEDYVDTWLEKN